MNKKELRSIVAQSMKQHKMGEVRHHTKGGLRAVVQARLNKKKIPNVKPVEHRDEEKDKWRGMSVHDYETRQIEAIKEREEDEKRLGFK